MKKNKSFLTILFVAVLILFSIGFYAYDGIYTPKNADSSLKKVFLIEKGQGLTDISRKLEREDIIKSSFLFTLYAVLKNKEKKLQAGAYLLSPSMNIPLVLEKIVSGDITKEKVTIIEGWNLRDIASELEAKKFFKPNNFFEVVGYPASVKNEKSFLGEAYFYSHFKFLESKPKGVSLEGYLFPDTYQFSQGTTPLEIAKVMLNNFQTKIKGLESGIKKTKLSLHQVITVASLLEKEVKKYEDKQVVAGILLKRLRNNWPLQVDATLTYIIDKGSSDLTKDDLRINSLYNTYKYKGLPPGPICNPGLDSIKAAIYYKDSPYWYYLTKANGDVIFSKTLKEHNINKAKYIK